MNRQWKWEQTSIGRRKIYKGKCSSCLKEIWRRKDYWVRWKNSFCSKECLVKLRTKAKIFQCGFCSKDVTRTPSQLKKSKTGSVYCDRSCATSANNKFKTLSNHPNWRGSDYRNHALKIYGSKCQNKNCQLSHIAIETKMLDVHHIDGDRSNNKIENLQVLCVWCHALKTRKNW